MVQPVAMIFLNMAPVQSGVGGAMSMCRLWRERGACADDCACDDDGGTAVDGRAVDGGTVVDGGICPVDVIASAITCIHHIVNCQTTPIKYITGSKVIRVQRSWKCSLNQ